MAPRPILAVLHTRDAMRKFGRITTNPEVLGAQPIVRGMRLTVRRVVEAVAIYPDRKDLYREYPELEAQGVRQARVSSS